MMFKASSPAEEQFQTRLAHFHHSMTQPRLAIFRLLESAGRPMSTSEVATESPTIDRATVYRVIALFEEIGVVKRVWFGFKSKIELSDDFQAHHHHLVCEQCGRIESIDHNQLEKTVSKLTKKAGYRPTTHHIEIFGLCPECLNKVT